MTDNIESTSTILAQFRYGVAKPTRYRIEFNLPPGVSGTNGIDLVNTESRAGSIQSIQGLFNRDGGINLKCHTANMPQRAISTYEVRQNSAPFSMPFSATYDPVTFSFYANSEFDTREFFEVWQSAALNVGTNTFNFPNEYVSDIKMFALDTAGRDTYGVTLYEAWPFSVGVVDLSYSQTNTMSIVSVSLRYKLWKPILNDTAVLRTV